MERKKKFLEEGDWFDRIWDGTIGRLENACRRFGKTRAARLLGMALVACMMVYLIYGTIAGGVSTVLRNWDLRVYLQCEAGLPEAAGISGVEFKAYSDVLDMVASGWTVMWTVDHYREEVSEPFSEEEIKLLEESTFLLERLHDWNDYHGLSTSLALYFGYTVGAGLLLKKRTKRILQAMLIGMGIGLLPPAFVVTCFLRDFSQSLQLFCGKLFSVDLSLFTPETSLLARLFPQSVLEGLGRNILYKSGMYLAVILGIFIVFDLICIVAETWSKRKKLKEDEANESFDL